MGFFSQSQLFYKDFPRSQYEAVIFFFSFRPSNQNVVLCFGGDDDDLVTVRTETSLGRWSCLS